MAAGFPGASRKGPAVPAPATVAKPLHLSEPSGQYASGQVCKGSGLPSPAVSANAWSLR